MTDGVLVDSKITRGTVKQRVPQHQNGAYAQEINQESYCIR